MYVKPENLLVHHQPEWEFPESEPSGRSWRIRERDGEKARRGRGGDEEQGRVFGEHEGGEDGKTSRCGQKKI